MKTDFGIGKQHEFSADFLRELFHVNPFTGVATWLKRPGETKECKRWNTRYAGKQVGHLHKSGYLRVKLLGKTHLLHRLIFTWYHDKSCMFIDHKDNNRLNNAIFNLRPCNKKQNVRNSRLRISNSSGYKNVWLHKPTGKWGVSVTGDQGLVYLGLYVEKETAAAVAKKARHLLQGEFGRDV